MATSLSEGSELERLSDYLGRSPETAEGDEAYEEDLFARAADGRAPELEAVDSLVSGVVDLAARGTLEMFLDRAQSDELRARYGDRLSFIELGSERVQRVAVSPDAELVVTRIPVDLDGVAEVEAEIVLEGSAPLKSMRMRVKPGADALYACCEGDLARAAYRPGIVTRFWAVAPGERRLLRELVTED